MTTSEETDKLWPAMVAAYASVRVAFRDSENEPDGFRYASLSAVHESIHAAISPCGLAVIQQPKVSMSPSFVVAAVIINTRVIHASGQWFEPEPLAIPVAAPHDARAIGEAITYGRKYHLAPIFGVTVDAGDADQPHARPRKPTSDEVRMGEAVAAEVERVGLTAANGVFRADMSPAQVLVALRALPSEGDPIL
jgi:hypothetical protein